MTRLLVLDPRDEIGVCVEGAERGAELSPPSGPTFKALTEIPPGHKIALYDLPSGTVVHKYGQPIGRTSIDVRTGEHVHVHNLDSLRAGGTTR